MIKHDRTKLWTTTKIGSVCLALQYGYTASAMSERCGPRFLRITDIQDGQVQWASVPFCEIARDQIDKYALRPGDIVFARTGGTVGKSFLINSVPEPAVFASYLIRLTAHPEINPKYLYYFFQSVSYWEQIGLKKGGLQGNVNATTLSSLEIPLCSTRHQQRIVERFEELFSKIEEGERCLSAIAPIANQALGLAANLRQSILKKGFYGNLVAQDANDEPAFVLLQRIAAEGKEGSAITPRRNKNAKTEAA